MNEGRQLPLFLQEERLYRFPSSRPNHPLFVLTTAAPISLVGMEETFIGKEYEGMGFRRLTDFNTALLVKQGWRIFNFLNSLLSRVLKAKDFPQSNFLQANLGNFPSFTWKSIWAASKLLRMGLCWRVRNGEQISLTSDAWIPGLYDYRLTDSNMHGLVVANLINSNTSEWNRELIYHTCDAEVAEKIVQILLSREEHKDVQV